MDRFQIALGCYHFAAQYSGVMCGAGHESRIAPSRIAARLAAIKYRPSQSEERFDSLYAPGNERALDTYLRLSGEY